jgi:hypothetical protein
VDLRVVNADAARRRDCCSVIVQVIAFRSATHRSMVEEQMLNILGPRAAACPITGWRWATPLFANPDENGRSGAKSNSAALAKIRKTVPGGSKNGSGVKWENWDGWIPSRDVEVFRTDDSEVFANATRDLGHPLRLGRTLDGHKFCIEGQDIEKVSVITGVKGSGKSHLAKVILLQLIERGAPCLVFDINREYIHLPKANVDPKNGVTLERGIVHLEAGGNFRLGVRQFGLAPLMTLLERYGLPEVSALHFENRVIVQEEVIMDTRAAPYIDWRLSRWQG